MTEQSKILAGIETLKSLAHDNQEQADSYAIKYQNTYNSAMHNYFVGKTQAYQNALEMLQTMVEG